jgi:acid stress-induced BolA-like protein IbaG/YrbA
MMLARNKSKDDRRRLPCEHLSVEGRRPPLRGADRQREFVGKSRVSASSSVYATLKAAFDGGEMHALSMQTLTPEEWSAARG